MRWSGAEVSSLEDLRSRSQISLFMPESLLLVKGSPARRRAHLDTYAGALDKQYAAAVRDMQDALRQRNAQLVAVKAGASARGLDPWDTQFARVAAELGRRRRDLVAELGGRFTAAAAALTPQNETYALQLVTQLEGVDFEADALQDELLRRRPGEISRGLSLYGPQRDDLRFYEAATPSSGSSGPLAPAADLVGSVCGSVELPPAGRDLRLFGSQGEQRLAVLALLLAEQEVAGARTNEVGTLFLDDVMSELDDARRRLLICKLSVAGQTIITTTNRQYFTEDELAGATLIELPLRGSLDSASRGVPTESAGPAPPAVDAL